MTTLSMLAFRYQMVESISSTIAISLGIILIYIVLFRSPSEMGRFKYLIVNTTAADVIYSFFCFYLFEPVPLFPAFSGICIGPFRYFGRHFCFYGFVSFVLFFGYTIWSLTLCFLYRYLILMPKSIAFIPTCLERYIDSSNIMSIAFVIGLFFISFPMIFLILGQENDYEVVRNYTGTIWAQYKMDLDKFVLFGTSMNTNGESTNSTKFTYLFIISIIILLFFNSLITIGLSILIYRELNKHKYVMSSSTYKMHKTLTNILLAQTFLPIGFLLIPIFTCIGYVLTDYVNDVLIQLSMAPLAMFPVLNDALFLYCSPPHRKAFVLFMKSFKNKIIELIVFILMAIRSLVNKVFL